MSLLLPKHTFEKLLQEVSVSDADMKSYIMEWKGKKKTLGYVKGYLCIFYKAQYTVIFKPLWKHQLPVESLLCLFTARPGQQGNIHSMCKWSVGFTGECTMLSFWDKTSQTIDSYTIEVLWGLCFCRIPHMVHRKHGVYFEKKYLFGSFKYYSLLCEWIWQ